jgi:hypothetical protein
MKIGKFTNVQALIQAEHTIFRNLLSVSLQNPITETAFSPCSGATPNFI